MLDAFRHRYVLAHYMALSLAALISVYALGLTDVRLGVSYPAILVGLVAALMAGWAYLAAALAVMALLRGTSARRRVTIWLEPALLVAAVAAVQTLGLSLTAMADLEGWSPRGFLAMTAFCFVGFGLAVAYLLERAIPRSVVRLRMDRVRAAPGPEAVGVAVPAADPPGGTEGIGESAVQAGATEEAATEREAEEGPADAGIFASVLRLEANRNYVTVVTERGRTMVPGPFSDVVARMPKGAGRQVHRSHWVARRAVVGDQRVGRDFLLKTADGETVPVSPAKVLQVRAWLDQGRATPMDTGRGG